MTDSDPLYRRCAGCQRLYRSEASDQAAAAGYWAGWLAGSDGASDPIALSQAWADSAGTLLFLPVAPTDPADFEARIRRYIEQSPAGFHPRLLWLRNPRAPDALWDASALTLGSDGTLSRTLDYKLADYSFRLAAHASFSLQTGGAQAQFVAGGTGIRLQAPRAGFELGSATLPMAGPALGAWQGQLTLNAGTAYTLETLGVMLRYARLQSGSQDSTESVDLPILRQRAGSSPVSLALGIDPLLPLNGARTLLRFTAAPALASGWATTLGHDVTLTPTTSATAGLDVATLVFAATPRRLSDPTAGTNYHLAPSGAFALDTAPPPGLRARLPVAADGTQEQLMLGLAGTEYLALPTAAQTLAVFVPAQAAFLKPSSSAEASDPDPQPLGAQAQTSYASFVALSGTGDALSAAPALSYYAQPQKTPLYAAAGSATVLDYQPVLSGQLASLPAAGLGASALTVFPVGAYNGMNPAYVNRAAAIELAGLVPVRRRVIPLARVAGSASGATRAVTPPGLVAEVDASHYQQVIIANLPQSSTPTVAFGPISDDFQKALQSNQVFFVVSQPAVLGPQTGLNVELSKWRFKLGPESWRTDPNSPTLLVFKIAGRSLVDLAADTAAWGWKEAANNPDIGGIAGTSKALVTLLAAAAAAPIGSPYKRFYDSVANNPAWSGVLFFNAAIDVGQLDPQLGFVTAGINLQQFYAHHIGFALTPYALNTQTRQIELKQTAAFGLVDYQDRIDLNITVTVPFAYKTLALTAQFSNAALSGFSAEVELLTNQLFGTELAKLQPERGNNLVLAGSYHDVAGAPAYAFDLIGRNVYATQSGVLSQIDVQTVSLQTETQDGGQLITRFALTGNLLFADNPDFDLYAWGPATDGSGAGRLRFANLVVRMHSMRDGSGTPSFDNLEGALSFDLANSKPRPESLIAKFPVTLTGFIAVPGGEDAPGPEKLGYASIAMPLDQSQLSGPWYGLSYTLQLGTLGNLAGSVGLSLQMLTAWAPQSDGQAAGIYLGLKVPGLNDLGFTWPLQGVLSLGFRSFEMQRYLLPNSTDRYGYLLRLHRLALTFLGFSVPPGNTDVVLFGNPDEGAKGPFGWYAAYAKDIPPAKKKSADAVRAVRSGPRSDIARLRRQRGGSHTP